MTDARKPWVTRASLGCRVAFRVATVVVLGVVLLSLWGGGHRPRAQRQTHSVREGLTVGNATVWTCEDIHDPQADPWLDRCAYARAYCTEPFSGGFINFMTLHYCSLGGSLLVTASVVTVCAHWNVLYVHNTHIHTYVRVQIHVHTQVHVVEDPCSPQSPPHRWS